MWYENTSFIEILFYKKASNDCESVEEFILNCLSSDRKSIFNLQHKK